MITTVFAIAEVGEQKSLRYYVRVERGRGVDIPVAGMEEAYNLVKELVAVLGKYSEVERQELMNVPRTYPDPERTGGVVKQATPAADVTDKELRDESQRRRSRARGGHDPCEVIGKLKVDNVRLAGALENLLWHVCNDVPWRQMHRAVTESKRVLSVEAEALSKKTMTDLEEE